MACNTAENSLRKVAGIQARMDRCMLQVAMTGRKQQKDSGHVFITLWVAGACFGYMPATPARYVPSVSCVRLMHSKAPH